GEAGSARGVAPASALPDMPPPDSPSLQPARTTSSARTRYGRLPPPQHGNAFVPSVDATLDPFGLWRSLVARSVRVGEVAGSNPVSPIFAPRSPRRARPAYAAVCVRTPLLTWLCSSRSAAPRSPPP